MIRLTKCQACLKILSDPTRAKIVELLARHERLNVNSIVDHFNLRQPTLSHHLAILKDNNFVKSHKKGNAVYYSLNYSCHSKKSSACYLLVQSSLGT